MKSIRKSNFAGLVQYMTSAQGKEERLGEIRITNCHNHDINWATHEIQATQAQNQRALGDKTYHLVISFPAGEVPSQDVLRDIEKRVCASIGYKEHQRISVIHYDTDNFHIHVGINKIHPARYTLYEPYLAYKKLADVAVKLELEHGLQNTNHIPRKVGSENRADDMEHHAGIESLLGWIKRECMEHIKAAQSWSELHQVMQKYGLELREQGNGLIIIDASGVRVKASSVARELSKPKLEKRYGAFERNTINRTTGSFQKNRSPIGKIGKKPPHRSRNRLYRLEALEHMSMDKGLHYQPQPINRSINTVELYARYQGEQKHALSYRNKELVNLRNKKNKSIESALRTGRLKRSAIKLLSGSKISKKLLYALVNKTLKEDILKAKQNYLKECDALYKKYHRYAWADWLKVKAQEGDVESLDALRARVVHKSFKGNLFAGQNREKTNHQSEIAPDNITKQGTIIYRVNSCAIRDDGNRLNISRGSTKKGIETALHMAIKRYGECLTVNGSAEFKEQVVRIAVDLKLNLQFDDPTLEQQRRLLIQTSHLKEKHDESRKQPIIKPRRTNRGGNERSGSVELSSTRTRAGDTWDTRKSYQPNLSLNGKQPPPASKNSLRNLSQLSVVQLSSGGEMLLPRHVPNHLEHQRAKSNDPLRRGVSRSVGIHFNSIATTQYIAERESKREKMVDIPKHRIFDPGDQGMVQFAGIRQINDEFLALLKREEQIIVLPIDQNQLQKMKRLSINAPIKLTSKGALVFKGRRR